MSQFSKVNPTLQQQIVNLLSAQEPTTSLFNGYIQTSLPDYWSLRTVQEATQKLTAQGVLVRVGQAYKLATVPAATAATASN